MTTRQNKVKPIKQFGFLRAIIAVSATAVILLFAYSILFLNPSFTALIAENTERNAVRIATFITHNLFKEGQQLERQTLTPDFPDKINDIVRDFNLMKVKIFSPSGETIFSTSPEDIGVINTKDYFHTIVAKGKPYTKIVQKDDKSLEDQIVSLDVVETYVPRMAGSTFLGAFEIYVNITDSKYKLDRLVSRSNILLQIIGGGLLFAIFIISLKAKSSIIARIKAEKTIIQQSEILQSKNDELSILNEISAAISRSIDMDRLLPAILDTIAVRLKTFSTVTRGGIFLLADDKLILTAHMGHDELFLKSHENVTISDCLCGEAARTGEIVFCANSATDDRHTLCCSHGEPHGHIIIPLKAHNRVVGVLYLYTETDITIKDKEALLNSIGSQVGLAIDNANLYKETKRLSLHDPLTGLANRRLMDNTLEMAVTQAERYSRSFSIAMADIDFFKKYNDSMGHAAGDRILASVASIIKKEIREADFAARYGGEEFLIIFNETPGDEACLAAERIRNTIEKKSGVTISLGVSTHMKGDDQTKLIKRADLALYAAKEKGRNRVELS